MITLLSVVALAELLQLIVPLCTAQKVILFEAKEVGGTCVNLGCVPKKVMWYGAQVAETLNTYASEYGFQVWSKLLFDF